MKRDSRRRQRRRFQRLADTLVLLLVASSGYLGACATFQYRGETHHTAASFLGAIDSDLAGRLKAVSPVDAPIGETILIRLPTREEVEAELLPNNSARKLTATQYAGLEEAVVRLGSFVVDLMRARALFREVRVSEGDPDGAFRDSDYQLRYRLREGQSQWYLRGREWSRDWPVGGDALREPVGSSIQEGIVAAVETLVSVRFVPPPLETGRAVGQPDVMATSADGKRRRYWTSLAMRMDFVGGGSGRLAEVEHDTFMNALDPGGTASSATFALPAAGSMELTLDVLPWQADLWWFGLRGGFLWLSRKHRTDINWDDRLWETYSGPFLRSKSLVLGPVARRELSVGTHVELAATAGPMIGAEITSHTVSRYYDSDAASRAGTTPASGVFLDISPSIGFRWYASMSLGLRYSVMWVRTREQIYEGTPRATTLRMLGIVWAVGVDAIL